MRSAAGSKYTTYPRTNEDFLINIAKTNPLDYKFYGARGAGRVNGGGLGRGCRNIPCQPAPPSHAKPRARHHLAGVCVPSCPGFLDVVCNYDDPSIAAPGSLYTQPTMLACLTNGSFVPPAGVSCATVNAHCWVTPQLTQSVFFRCIPAYNVTSSAADTCIYPPGITNANGERPRGGCIARLPLLRGGVHIRCCQ